MVGTRAELAGEVRQTDGQVTASGPQNQDIRDRRDPLSTWGSNNGQCAAQVGDDCSLARQGRELPCRCRLGAG